jgi:hypothetical protein
MLVKTVHDQSLIYIFLTFALILLVFIFNIGVLIQSIPKETDAKFKELKLNQFENRNDYKNCKMKISKCVFFLFLFFFLSKIGKRTFIKHTIVMRKENVDRVTAL